MHSNDILDLTKTFVNSVLAGAAPTEMCFTVCYPLSLLLQLKGVDNFIDEGQYDTNLDECKHKDKCKVKGKVGHYWITLKEGEDRVIDPTISQFCAYRDMPLMLLSSVSDRIVPTNNYSFSKIYKKWSTPLLSYGYRNLEWIKCDPSLEDCKIELKHYIPVIMRAAEILCAENVIAVGSLAKHPFYKDYFDCIHSIVALYAGQYDIEPILYPNVFESYYLSERE